jgi:pimeloyl-ACP methyl ester carboxylesterase
VYYEIHGEGEPLVLLHGANMNIDGMAPLLEPLASYRKVIAPELQGHGRTADDERPITYEGMADDTAALLDELGIERADIVGFSMGAGVGLQLTIRHPERVRRLVAASTAFAAAGRTAEAREMFATMTPEMFKGSPMEAEYQRLSPHPDRFEGFVLKLRALFTTDYDWSDGVRGISAPVLLIAGDTDIVRPAHIVEFFELLPNAQLAVLPGTTHFTPLGSRVLDRADWMHPMIRPFLEAE